MIRSKTCLAATLDTLISTVGRTQKSKRWGGGNLRKSVSKLLALQPRPHSPCANGACLENRSSQGNEAQIKPDLFTKIRASLPRLLRGKWDYSRHAGGEHVI